MVQHVLSDRGEDLKVEQLLVQHVLSDRGEDLKVEQI